MNSIKLNWDAEETGKLVVRLTEVLNTFDWSEAKKICCKLIEDIYHTVNPFPQEIAETLLKALRRKPQLELMTLLGEALIRTGLSSPKIRELYAQALIDQGFDRCRICPEIDNRRRAKRPEY